MAWRGLKEVHRTIDYQATKILTWFVEQVTEARCTGHVDRSKALLAEMFKLLVNSGSAGNSLKRWSGSRAWSTQKTRRWWTEPCEAGSSKIWTSSGSLRRRSRLIGLSRSGSPCISWRSCGCWSSIYMTWPLPRYPVSDLPYWFLGCDRSSGNCEGLLLMVLSIMMKK